MSKKVSVILPVWNGEKYIHRSIRSLQSQTYENFECLIVDDGSTDQTKDIAENLVSNDIRFKVAQIPHNGLSVARNFGLDHTSGEIVFHMDVDDEAMPEMIEKSVNFLDDNNLEIAFFDADSVAEGISPSREKSIKRYFTRNMHYRICSGKEMLDCMSINNDFVYAVFIQAARRTAIRKKFCKGLRAQDMLYSVQNLFLANLAGHLPEILYIKHTTEDSVSVSKHDAHFAWSLLRTINELQSFAEEQNLSRCFGIEAAIEKTYRALAYAIEHLDENDWKKIMSMPFYERTSLCSLGMLISTPAVKRRLGQMLIEDDSIMNLTGA